MIETIKLTAQQLDALAGNGDWMQLTTEQFDLVQTQGPARNCAIVGDKFVRMPSDQFEAMLKAAFHAACHAGYSQLGLKSDAEIQDIEMAEYQFGDRFFTVTVTATNGRSATASGALVLPTHLH